ncbi:hypothetical protein RRG08_054368 [Elysia crispata]|uniref:Uncharacterized protein n=1 Tax=Elysia crispata TaxID=231223 RepID=A0AAE1B5Y7_9GAST|nr:hypothetical protein RRG08_054368 [Elysia crispata]
MVRAHSLQFCKSNTATVTGNENEIRILGHLPDEVSHTVQSHPQLPGGQLGELSALLDTGHAHSHTHWHHESQPCLLLKSPPVPSPGGRTPPLSLREDCEETTPVFVSVSSYYLTHPLLVMRLPRVCVSSVE